MVSVLMSVYNGERHLREAVDSILAQTYSDFEFIIMNDGSRDSTPAILDSYTDRRVRVLNNPTNIGSPRSLNRGLEAARGKYIARQDADDVALPGRLAAEVEFLESHPEVVLVGTTTIFVDANGTFQSVFPNPATDLEAKWTMLSHNAFSHTSVMFRRALLDHCGRFPEAGYGTCEDFHLWSRFARLGRVANLQEPLVKWRSHEGCISHRQQQLQLDQVAAIARDNLRWVMGWEEMDPRLWAAWQKFCFTPGMAPVSFGPDEVELLSGLLLKLTDNFYAAYVLSGPEVRRHRREVHLAWGRHALGLAYKRGSGSSLGARQRLLSLGLRLLASAPLPPKRVPPKRDAGPAVAQRAQCAGGSSRS